MAGSQFQLDLARTPPDHSARASRTDFHLLLPLPDECLHLITRISHAIKAGYVLLYVFFAMSGDVLDGVGCS